MGHAGAAIVAALVGGGCTAAAAPVPARLAAASPECLAEMTAFMSARTGAQVTLAPASFADSDRVLLDRPVRRDAQGRPLQGRRVEPPHLFLLRMDGQRCLLVDAASREQTALQQCRCSPLAR
ncbi:MAG: hypothetical protein LW847_13190 [Burkholderiales bacterium]|jgi:hypothetical protein|nr:hypothetical protein [Burkholderiales bacterium]